MVSLKTELKSNILEDLKSLADKTATIGCSVNNIEEVISEGVRDGYLLLRNHYYTADLSDVTELSEAENKELEKSSNFAHKSRFLKDVEVMQEAEALSSAIWSGSYQVVQNLRRQGLLMLDKLDTTEFEELLINATAMQIQDSSSTDILVYNNHPGLRNERFKEVLGEMDGFIDLEETGNPENAKDKKNKIVFIKDLAQFGGCEAQTVICITDSHVSYYNFKRGGLLTPME